MKIKKYKENKIRAKARQIFIFLFFLLILSLIAFPLARKLKLSVSANQEVKAIEDDLAALENDNRELRELIAYFGTDGYVEEQARLSLNYRKAGEKVAIIYDNGQISGQESNAAVSGPSGQEGGSMNNPSRWKQYFFNNHP